MSFAFIIINYQLNLAILEQMNCNLRLDEKNTMESCPKQ